MSVYTSAFIIIISGFKTVLLRETVRYRGSPFVNSEYIFTLSVTLLSAATSDIYVAPVPLTIALYKLNVTSTSGTLTSRCFNRGIDSSETGVAH